MSNPNDNKIKLGWWNSLKKEENILTPFAEISAQTEGTNGQDVNLDTDMIGDAIVGKANSSTSGTIKKNLGNRLQRGLDLFALGSAVSNYSSTRDAYGDTLGNLKEAIGHLSDSKTNIADALNFNVQELKSDFSEGMQNTALSTIEKNKSDLMALDNTSSDFATGIIGNKKEEALGSINRVLNNTFKAQQVKVRDAIESNVQSARSVTDQLSADIKNIETEMKKVKKAKDEQWKNLAKDLVGYASYYVDPTGSTKDIIQSTKFENEYT
tara:strand:+ start:309 stop:1112 length:804 start_codon:yes stop_codon:yes gene_type:complete